MIERIFLAPQQITPTEALSLSSELFEQVGTPSAGQLAIELPLQQKMPGMERRLQAIGMPLAFAFMAPDLNPVSLDPEIAALSKNRYLEAIQWALQCQVQYLLLPSLDMTAHRVTGQYRAWFGRTVAFWESILEKLPEQKRLTLILLNQQDPNPDTLLTLVKRLNHPNVKAGLDVGMSKLFSTVAPLDWLGRLGEHCAYVRFGYYAEDGHTLLPIQEDEQEMPAIANHLALVNRKVAVSLMGDTLNSTQGSVAWLENFVALQQEQFAAKRFLV